MASSSTGCYGPCSGARPPPGNVKRRWCAERRRVGDVFWDKIVEISNIGEQDTYRVVVAETDNAVVQAISFPYLTRVAEPT
jgi:hypothetical protein